MLDFDRSQKPRPFLRLSTIHDFTTDCTHFFLPTDNSFFLEQQKELQLLVSRIIDKQMIVTHKNCKSTFRSVLLTLLKQSHPYIQSKSRFVYQKVCTCSYCHRLLMETICYLLSFSKYNLLV